MGSRRKDRLKDVYDTLLGQAKADVQAELTADAQADAQTIPQSETHAKSQPSTHADTQTFSQAQVTDEETLRERVRRREKKRRLEDDRRRQTYWLDETEIEMIDQLSDATGMAKYEIVSAAIRLLYRRVMEGED